MHEYIVQYKDNKKLLKIENKKDLKEEVQSKLQLNLENFNVEVYHSEIGSYYEIDSLNDLPEKGILKLVSSSPSPCISAAPVERDLIYPSTSNAAASLETPTKPCPSTYNEAATDDSQNEWPAVFHVNINTFPNHLKMALDEKKPWTTTLERSLMSSLYEQITRIQL
jgi:hypothetical protein